MKRREYVQFSKRMTVVAVVAAVVVASGTEILLWQMDNASGVVEVCRALLTFAGLVFAAYCGNSAVEKWAIFRYGGTDKNDNTENG